VALDVLCIVFKLVIFVVVVDVEVIVVDVEVVIVDVVVVATVPIEVLFGPKVILIVILIQCML
jgi:hypothetical protein